MKGRLLSPPALIGASLVLFAALLFTNDFLLFGATAVAAGLILLPFSPLLTMAFYTCVLAFSVPINDIPLEVGDFRFYGSDFAVYLVGCVAAYWLWAASRQKTQLIVESSRLDRLIITLVLLNVGWGVVEVANGVYIYGLDLRDAIGDFRRIYVYMLAVLIPVGLPIRASLLRKMPYVFAVGGAGAILFGLNRMTTGVLYHSFTSHVDSPRILGDNELVALTFLLAYVVALVAGKANPIKKLLAIPFGAAAVAFMLLSGWRYGIALAVGVAPMTLVVVGLMKNVKLGRLALRAVPAAFVVVLGALIVFSVFEETVNYVWQMRRARQQMYQQDARTAAYATALNEYAQKPVIGTGLGHQLVYFAVTSSGEMESRQSTTHNIFIDVLYQTGAVGILLFLGLQALLTWHFLKNAKKIDPKLRGIAAALFIGYAATMGLFCTQPSHPAAVMSTYLTMGFLLRILRSSPQNSSNPVILSPSPSLSS